MNITVEYQFESLLLARPFVISRGSRTAAEVVVVTISDGTYTVLGEATPTPRYGQTVEFVANELEHIVPSLREFSEPRRAREWLDENLAAGVARNALDCALWQLEARQLGMSLEQLVAAELGEKPLDIKQVTTVQTVGIDTPEAMAEVARQEVSKGISLLKIKLDGHQVKERMQAIREAAPNARLVVDANEAFPSNYLAEGISLLSSLGVEMLEQPFPAGKDELLSTVDHLIPVCADESCHTSADVARLAGRYEMVNIKLDKCGGLTEGIRLLVAARKAGMGVMVGCMLGSSIAMRAAIPLASRARLVDLDGPTWLAHDPIDPLCFNAGIITF